MALQIIHGIIRGADQGDAGIADNVANAHGGVSKLLIAELPDFLCSVLVQNALIIKILAKLQVTPVKEGIADGLPKALSPFQEFIFVGCIARNIFFLYSAGTHKAPFIVVAAEPNLRHVVKLAILPDFLLVDVAVVIQNGHACRVVKI